MTVWIALILIAVVFRVLIANPSLVSSNSQIYTLASAYSNFILQFPSIILLPLIIGAVIGAEVGRKSMTAKNALRSGMLNGIYAAVVYLIAMIAAYTILNYTNLQSVPTYTMIMQSIAIPIVVFLVVLELLAVLSHMRKME